MSERQLQPDDRLWWETDRIDVTSSLPRPDPRWTYTDQQGHEHRREDGRYPTLVVVQDEPVWCPDCREEHAGSHYECPLCGEEIAPGLVSAPPYREYVPGLTHFYLNGEEITPDEYQRLAEQMGGTNEGP